MRAGNSVLFALVIPAPETRERRRRLVNICPVDEEQRTRGKYLNHRVPHCRLSRWYLLWLLSYRCWVISPSGAGLAFETVQPPSPRPSRTTRVQADHTHSEPQQRSRGAAEQAPALEPAGLGFSSQLLCPNSVPLSKIMTRF